MTGHRDELIWGRALERSAAAVYHLEFWDAPNVLLKKDPSKHEQSCIMLPYSEAHKHLVLIDTIQYQQNSSFLPPANILEWLCWSRTHTDPKISALVKLLGFVVGIYSRRRRGHGLDEANTCFVFFFHMKSNAHGTPAQLHFLIRARHHAIHQVLKGPGQNRTHSTN